MCIINDLKKQRLINDNEKVSPWLERKISEDLRKKILRETCFLEYNAKLSDRIKIIQLGIKEQPKCKCGNVLKYEKTLSNFTEYCSVSCVSLYTIEKKLDTNQERYGKRSMFATISKEQKTINAKKAADISKKSILKKYGVTNVMYVPEVKKNHLEKVRDQKFQNKRISTRSKTNKHYCYDTNDLNSYRRAVLHYTRHSGFESLPNHDKRGRSGTEGAYQLDHKISIFEGFIKKIDPQIIGSINNLQYITWQENVKKSCTFVIINSTDTIFNNNKNKESRNGF